MPTKITNLILILSFAFVPVFVFAQNSTSLPIAATHEISGALEAGGEIVVFDEKSQRYSISKQARDETIYGVTAVRPALVFTVGSGTIPVVTSGATRVRVSEDNGLIKRGDVLTSSGMKGIAMRADISDDAVFAVALEDFVKTQSTTSPDTVIAEVGIEQARTLQETRRALEKQKTEALMGSTSSSTQEKGIKLSLVRGGIAAVIAIVGLSFILFSFRSTIAKGVVSIGRNPRARTSIIALSVGNIIFALLLCAVVIFIAVGVLVLPL